MMKFIFAIAMFTLIGFSLTSAAAIETGENDTPASMNDFKESLENLLLGVSEAIKENAKFDENMDLESLIPQIKIDVEESSIETEEKEDPPRDGISTGEDVEDDENGGSRIYCHWRGHHGRCCRSFRVLRVRLHLCLTADIHPPRSMTVLLQLNGHRIWQHTITTKHVYRICLTKGHFRMCFYIYKLYISSHSVRACLHVLARYRYFRHDYHIGCIYKRFGENEISTNKETPLHFLENQKLTEDHFPIPKEMNQHNDVFGFDQ